MFIGIILVVFGAMFLLQNLGYITFDIWGIFWPVVLIAIGVKIAMKRGQHGHHWCCGHHREEKKEENPQQ